MNRKDWVVVASNLISVTLLCVGAYMLDGFMRETRNAVAVLAEAARPAIPPRLTFEWKGQEGTERLETTRDRGESFPAFLERHRLYIRLALED